MLWPAVSNYGPRRCVFVFNSGREWEVGCTEFRAPDSVHFWYLACGIDDDDTKRRDWRLAPDWWLMERYLRDLGRRKDFRLIKLILAQHGKNIFRNL